MTRYTLPLLLSILLISVHAVHSADDPYLQAVTVARPSVVMIEARSPLASRLGPLGNIIAAQSARTDQPKWYTSIGSGIIWDGSGHIVTTASVIKDASEYSVLLNDGNRYDADLLGISDAYNLAVLKFRETPASFMPVSHRRDYLPEGSSVILLGYGFGRIPTVATGVAGIAPEQFDSSRKWFQFTAPVRPGNSGGALIDIHGALAGIVLGREEDAGLSAIVRMLTSPPEPGTSAAHSASAMSNFGVAVPVSKAMPVIEIIIKSRGRMDSGWIGISVMESDCEFDHTVSGLKITQVIKDGPAEKCGLVAGDLILKMDDTVLTTAEQLAQFISMRPTGSSATVMYMRGKRKMRTRIVIQERPRDFRSEHILSLSSSRLAVETMGLQLQNMSNDLRRQASSPENTGVLVAEISSDSPFFDSRLKPGDILTGINGRTIGCIADFEEFVTGSTDTGSWECNVIRSGELLTIHLDKKPGS